jgi:hypothetical protein
MIDPIVAVGLVVAFLLTLAALLLSRRDSERSRASKVERTEEPRQRYVNGGWH